jgi:hypothetical protein
MDKGGGFIPMYRNVFDDPIVGLDADPLYFRGWLWLVSEAQYKPTRKRINGRQVIELQAVACPRFRRHRVKVFNGAGGRSWRGDGLRESSRLRQSSW